LQKCDYHDAIFIDENDYLIATSKMPDENE
jgi:hypothetical protein